MSTQGMKLERLRKYNEVVHAAIVQTVRDGNYRGTAARLAGINESTLRDWLNPAIQARDMGLTREEAPDPDYWDLLHDIEEAEADFEQQMISRVTAAANSGAPNTWQAAMTILERKMPEKFGKRDALKISGDEDHPLQVETRHLIGADDDTRSIGRDFLGRIAASRAVLAGGVRVRDESTGDEAGEIESTATEVPD
jgi:transposase-like protein